jgi:TonB-linked SusC/RagA family outer membrane protein
MSGTHKTWLALALAAAIPASAVAQEGGATITGRVVSETGQPLGSASVFIEGLNLGTLTRSTGEYTFLVPGARITNQQATLTARLIGYRPQSVQITLAPGTITQNFTLQSNPLQLGEVIITGAGTETTRERLGNVINSVDSAALTRANEPNFVQALAGKAPNVEVNMQSGDPGASSYVRIRGDKTIQGSGQPLIVVDGVPIDNTTLATGNLLASTVAPNRSSDLNPDDIESVEILKGAAAGAIYGARAGQGVILITTKSGQAGPTRFSLRSTVSVDEINKRVPLQRSFGHGNQGVAASCGAPGCNLTGNSWGPALSAGEAFDHFDALYTDGLLLDNDLTVSGGNERTTFYLSVGRMDHNGTLNSDNDEYDKTQLRLKASHFLRDDLRIGGNVSYVDARGSFIQKGSNVSGLMLGALRTPPNFDNRNWLDTLDNGQILHRSYRHPQPIALSVTRGYDNPFFVANAHTNTSELSRVMGNIDLEYDPLDWLNLRYTLGADYYTDQRLTALPPSSSDFPTGRIERADFTNYQIDHNLLATGSWAFNENVSGSLTLGQNLNSRNFKQFFVDGFSFVAPQPLQLDNTVDKDPDEFESLVHTESYFGQVTLDLYNQLFLTGALRNDGFSTFAQSDQRHWFPKVSAAWTFTTALNQEQDRDWLGVFSFGKARAAYGETGQEPQPYQTITAFATANLADGGWGPSLSPTYNGRGGLYTSAIAGQESLRPERTREIEVGFDFGLFRDRADLGLTYYDSETEDVIFLAPIAPSSGFAAQAKNAATITNKGFEATLNIRPITRANFAWEVGFMYGNNKNEVIDLQGAEFVDMPGAFAGAPGAAVVGSKVGVLRGNDFVRCGRSDVSPEGVDVADVQSACSGAPTGALYIGADGFPVLDQTVRVIMDPHPDWTGSFRTSFTLWNRLNLSGLIDIRQGNEIWNGTRGALYNFGTHGDTRDRANCTIPADDYVCTGNEKVFGENGFHQGAVVGPGAGTAVPIGENWYNGLGGGFGPVASQFIEDGSFVKLREIALGYTFDQPWVNRYLGLTSLDVRVAGRNLKTWTDYSGIDPETNLGGAEVNLQGIDYFNNPVTRVWVLTFGLNR